MVLVLLKDLLYRFKDQLSVSDLLKSNWFSLVVDMKVSKVLDNPSDRAVVSAKG